MTGSHWFSPQRLARYGARLAAGGVLAVFGYILLFALGALWVKYPLPSPTRLDSDPPGAAEIHGAFHIHSTLSDGRGTPSQIARAAKSAGLQFVILSDHNLRTLSQPTFEDGVLVISGVELSTWSGHLVVVGAPRGLNRPDRELDPVRRSQRLGGLTILAHPVQRKQPWIDSKSAAQAAGMELYSADSLFRDALHSPFELLLPAAGAYLTNPMHALMILNRGQPDSTRKLLEISAREPKLALCAHDAHGFPPYELEFRSFSLHIPLTGKLEGGLPANASEAARGVIDAIARGSSYCVFDALGNGGGFAIRGLQGESRRAEVGDRLDVQLPPFLPGQARVQIWGGARLEPDGRAVALERSGPVQIEVWIAAPGRLFGRTWKPWIVPSPIFVWQRPASLGTEAGSGRPPVSTGSPGGQEAAGSR
jgi:hypothetical protein